MGNADPSGLRSRRDFISSTVAALAGLTVAPNTIPYPDNFSGNENIFGTITHEPGKSIIGQYGPWAASLAGDPPLLSFRHSSWKDLETWRSQALNKAMDCIASPSIEPDPDVETLEKFEFDGLTIERLQWKLPYGRPTEAILLKPADAHGPLPAILGFHDHGGNKYFGKRKMTRTGKAGHPLIEEHQEQYYGSRAWANEIAKRGYVVLVHDAFTFGSRRVMYQDVAGISWGFNSTEGRSDDDPEKPENIRKYNEWAGHHEHIMAKSLFCAGTTWPGVFLAEDQYALNILCSREDVDAERVGCAGLSGGGLRTVYLSGMDQRIKCAVAIGFMSTWRDFLINKSYTHTWMTYIPLLPKYLDFPEVMGLRVPLPTMIQNCIEDPLYTMPEVNRANQILSEIYAKAGAPECYQFNLYDGGHKFDEEMQNDAFVWFDKWLK